MSAVSMESDHVRGVHYITAKHGYQVTHAGKYLGFFKDIADALACKAAEMKISVTELRKKASQHNAMKEKSETPRKFKNIIRVANGWQAHKWQDGKLVYLGFATSDTQAAAIVANHTGNDQHIPFSSTPCPPPLSPPHWCRLCFMG